MKAMKFVLCLLVAMPLLAQMPGQYPPGQYPPGTMGGGGLSLPSWAHKKKKAASNSTTPDFKADGRTVSNDGKKLVVATADGRTLNLAVNSKTKYSQGESTIAGTQIVEGTTIHIEASEDEESNLTATTVQLVKAATVEERPSLSGKTVEKTSVNAAPSAKADTTTASNAPPVSKAPAKDDDDQASRPPLGSEPVDPDRPMLHRGKPANLASRDSDSEAPQPKRTVQTASAAAPKPSPMEAPAPAKESTDFTIDEHSSDPRKAPKGSLELVQRSIDWSQTFTQGLPNYVCEQNTTRYMQQSKAEGWQAQDMVTAKVIYEDGKEDYKEITVGGHKTSKSMLEVGGSTSIGEFGSTLHSLFSSYTNADFKFVESTSIEGTAAAVYDFSVALPHSDWTIQVGGQALRPAYSGSIWIDKKTAQVRRIEMKADKMPQDFPLDTTWWTVDYDVVPLGTAKFLLPVHAENLSCQRGSNICVKNATDFRNYHRYSGESTVTFK